MSAEDEEVIRRADKVIHYLVIGESAVLVVLLIAVAWLTLRVLNSDGLTRSVVTRNDISTCDFFRTTAADPDPVIARAAAQAYVDRGCATR